MLAAVGVSRPLDRWSFGGRSSPRAPAKGIQKAKATLWGALQQTGGFTARFVIASTHTHRGGRLPGIRRPWRQGGGSSWKTTT